ncbi:hypothetical protein LJB89_00530 [Tyzzerella sp. OttesenSCG-928-J15]|nr:hypothetical protein [Tyzzerella sp. OttesenSCG-928-J15]
MSKQNKKVICIKAEDDKIYDQVIFIMKNDEKGPNITGREKINFVNEAEKIINNKLAKTGINKIQQSAVLKKEESITKLIIKKSSTVDVIMNICLLFSCIFLTAIIISNSLY